MRLDLIDAISATRDLTHVFVLTHNVHLLYVQSVLGRALRNAGNPKLTIYADAAQARETYAAQGEWVQQLGRRFRLVPVPAPSGFCFHPKAVLLAGKTQARLFIGSGNLTFGGWRDNAEVWMAFDSATGLRGEFAAFRSFLTDIVDRLALNGPLLAELGDAFDPASHAWAADLPAANGLIGKAGSGPALLDQMLNRLGGRTFRRLTVCAPYFDCEGELLARLSRQFPDAEVRVLVQPKYSNLHKAAAAKMPRIKFQEVDSQVPATSDDCVGRSQCIHAKFFAFESDDETMLFTGSANCSLAALGIPGGQGNIELLTFSQLSNAEYAEFTKELIISDTPPNLTDAPPADEPVSASPAIHILAARLAGDRLEVAATLVAGVALRGMFVDGQAAEFQRDGAHFVAFPQGPCRSVRLEGELAGHHVRSPEAWIDHEAELDLAHTIRSLSGNASQQICPQNWNCGAWTEILRLFYQHLEYSPREAPAQAGQAGLEKESVPVTDIFTNSYGRVRELPIGLSERLAGMRGEVLGFLGHNVWAQDREESGEIPQDTGQSQDQSGEEPVDQEVPLPRKTTASPASDREKRRGCRRAAQIVDLLTSVQYLRRRTPKQLGVDIGIASVLFRSGLAEGWLSEEDFFEQTQRLWSVMFFAAPDELARNGHREGWLAVLSRKFEHQEEFRNLLSASQVAVSLMAWALCAAPRSSGAGKTRFLLANAALVAQFPWLWDDAYDDDFQQRVRVTLVNTGILDADNEQGWQILRNRMSSLFATGRAIHKVSRLGGPADLSGLITQPTVQKGELLWQGPAGFCVALASSSRASGICNVIKLSDAGKKAARFQGPMLVPVAALLAAPRVTNELGSDEATALSSFISELKASL